MKKIEINVSEHPTDVKRIQKVLANEGYEASLQDCEALWNRYSSSMCAGWINLPNDDFELFACINGYIEN